MNDFGSLEKNRWKIDSNCFTFARVKNQHENKWELKKWGLLQYIETLKFSLKREKTYDVNNFDWMIVTLRMATI